MDQRLVRYDTSVSSQSDLRQYANAIIGGALFGLGMVLARGFVLARRARLLRWTFVSAIGVGLMIAFGWWATNRHAGWSLKVGRPRVSALPDRRPNGDGNACICEC